MFLHCIFLILYSCSLDFLWWEDSSSFSYTFFYQYISLSFPIKKNYIKIEKKLSTLEISMEMHYDLKSLVAQGIPQDVYLNSRVIQKIWCDHLSNFHELLSSFTQVKPITKPLYTRRFNKHSTFTICKTSNKTNIFALMARLVPTFLENALINVPWWSKNVPLILNYLMLLKSTH